MAPTGCLSSIPSAAPSALQCLIWPAWPLTIGASAAVCALIGAALYYGKSRGGRYGQAIYRQVIGWVVGLFAFGLIVPGINNWGHGGGILGGILIGYLLGYHEKRQPRAYHKLIAGICHGGNPRHPLLGRRDRYLLPADLTGTLTAQETQRPVPFLTSAHFLNYILNFWILISAFHYPLPESGAVLSGRKDHFGHSCKAAAGKLKSSETTSPLSPNFLALLNSVNALPEVSQPVPGQSQSLYQTISKGLAIPALEQHLASFFGPPVKPAGQRTPLKLRFQPVGAVPQRCPDRADVVCPKIEIR